MTLMESEDASSDATKASFEMSVLFEFVVPGVLLNIIGLLGLIGNILSIIVLSRPQMKSSINCILIGLASYDLVLLITSILMFGLPAVHTYTQNLFSFYFYEVFPFITPAIYPIGMIAQTGSVYLTMCVTIERYVAVCLPLKARSLCTFGRARVYVICIGTFALLYNIPRFWEVTWRTVYYPEIDANITNVMPTALRDNKTYINVYITWLYLVVMYIVPFTCLAAFNLLIYHQVRRANSERARLTRLQQKEIGLATMLMVVVFVFFICNVLALVVNILEVMRINIIALNNVSNLLVTFNSSVNFIIYCIFGDKFKRIFVRMFCPPFLKRHSAAAAAAAAANDFMQRYPERAGPPGTAAAANGGPRHNNDVTAAADCNLDVLNRRNSSHSLLVLRSSPNNLDTEMLPLRSASTRLTPTQLDDDDDDENDVRQKQVSLSTFTKDVLRSYKVQRQLSDSSDDDDDDDDDDFETRPSRSQSRSKALKESLLSLGRIPLMLTRHKSNKKSTTSATTQTRRRLPPVTSTVVGQQEDSDDLRCDSSRQHQVFLPGPKHDITITVNINTCSSGNVGNNDVRCSSNSSGLLLGSELRDYAQQQQQQQREKQIDEDCEDEEDKILVSRQTFLPADGASCDSLPFIDSS